MKLEFWKGTSEVYISFVDIQAEFKQPIEYKILTAINAIASGFGVSTHKTAIAFSGGKDSTVLWHIIRKYFPEKSPEIIFGNTGVEYPESLKFAREIGKEWGDEHFHETQLSRTEQDGLKYQAQREVLEWLIKEDRISEVLKEDGKLKNTHSFEKTATPQMWEDFRKRKLVWPAGTIMSYWWCADQYGFPILGKAASKLDARRINIDCFLKFSESASDKEELLKYYDILKECKFSQHCCKLIKKEPSEKLQAELDIDVIFKGLMASESRTRKINFATRGYLFKSHRPHLGDDPFYHCNPLQIWTDEDIWEYIHKYDVPYSKLYDVGYIDNKGVEHKMQRNGCMGCATDILYKNNHQQMLRHTHHTQWKALMDYGMAEELRKLYKTRSKGIPTILDVFDSTDALLENRQCAFDDMDSLVDAEDVKEEYDPED